MNSTGKAYESGQPAAVVEFEYPDDEGSPEKAPEGANAEALALLFHVIEGARDCRSIGRRVVALAWIAGAFPELKDQRALARRLGCSQQRVSKIVQAISRSQREIRRAA